jgi:sugar-specific transcriptional regulator TrmB
MEIKKLLKNFGLKNAEIDVYLSLLELGPASAVEIAKHSKIKRTYIYDIVKSLQDKGILKTTFVKRKKQFVAISPDEFQNMQKQNLEQLNQLLPELRSIQRTTTIKPKISFFEGADGIYQIRQDILNNCKEFSAFSSDLLMEGSHKKASEEFIRDRVKRNIFARFICPLTPLNLKLQKEQKQNLRELRLIQKDKYFPSVITHIYGKNRVAFIDFKERFGLIIESYEINQAQLQLFNILWNSGQVQ